MFLSLYSETQNALHAAEQKANQEVLPSSKYSQLLEKVQTIPGMFCKLAWVNFSSEIQN